MFNIVFHKSAAKHFSKLDRPSKKRIAKAIDVLSVSPYLGKPLHGELSGTRRLRIGNFRIIYEIQLSEKTLLVHAIGSRGDVYKG